MFIAHETRMACLQAMGVDIDSPAAIEAAIAALDAAPWQQLLSPLMLVESGITQQLECRLPDSERNLPLHWQIETEAGEYLSGEAVPAQCFESGEYYITGTRYGAFQLPLPALPAGYHRVSASNGRASASASLVAAPAHCFRSEALADDRVWGITCQLYTLKSQRNWGIGDFGDLRELLDRCATAGMDFILLNPLHAPDFSSQSFASPYSPSDRLFFNALYIDLEWAASFAEAGQSLREQLRAQQSGASVAALRDEELVDYARVATLKFKTLVQLYRAFAEQHLDASSALGSDFLRFVEAGGNPLQRFAAYEAAHCPLAAGCAGDSRFYLYLQWMAQQQLEHCQRRARELGMRIGLVGDLAVGAIGDGAEVHGSPGYFCDRACIGAPPDPFNQQGQNWDLPAPNPLAMRETCYAHFIALFRANMKYYGGLRIDHVMGLSRLWWCPLGSEQGAYVYYPREILFALLRLESHRQQCVVIGEDMGVVEDPFRELMQSSAMLNNRLFYFEREHDGAWRSPQAHSAETLFMVSNHDVPTLAAWWSGADIELRAQLGMSGDASEADRVREQAERKQDRQHVLSWLDRLGFAAEISAIATDPVKPQLDWPLCSAILLACAKSRSKILCLQLEDLQLIEAPVNIPGTHLEYPNWRRKQLRSVEEIFSDKAVNNLLAGIDRERKHGTIE
ncbi:MAG: 4-alpha-glucanotransferase [Pseudomonadales bacterium]